MTILQPELDTTETRLAAPITGFVDYNPQEQYLFNTWLHQVGNCYERFGFTPLHLRPFERLQALKGEGDTQKQIFEVFRNDTAQSTSLGIPFDHTVPLALWVAQHAGHLQHLPLPYKRYDLGLSFRGERPKMGRFRAFVQADVDIVGRNLGLSADVECITALLTALQELQVGEVRVFLNHIGIVKSLLKKYAIAEELHAAVLRSIDKLDKISSDQVAKELMQIPQFSLSSSQVETFLSHFQKKTALSSSFWEQDFGEDAKEGVDALRQLGRLFAIAGQNTEHFFFAPGMVRGLAYYTGVVFETFLVGKESCGSIASGGRYSHLVGDFASGLEDVEGVGGSLGLTRLFDVLRKTALSCPQRTTVAQVLIGARSNEQMELAYQVAALLRKKGVRVDVYSGPCKIKQILSHANAIGIPQAILVMDEKAIVVKDMKAQTQKEYLSCEELMRALL